MKKFLSVILSFLLVFAMMFSLAACQDGNNTDNDDESSSAQSESSDEVSSDEGDNSSAQSDEEIDIVGNYVASVSADKIIAASQNTTQSDVMEYCDFEGLNMEFSLTVQDDNNLKMYVDRDRFMDFCDDSIQRMLDGSMKKIKENSQEEFGMTFDEMLAEANMTETQFREAVEQVTLGTLNKYKETLYDQLEMVEGKYEFDGNTIKIKKEDGDEECEFKDGKIYMEIDPITLVFEKV